MKNMDFPPMDSQSAPATASEQPIAPTSGAPSTPALESTACPVCGGDRVHYAFSSQRTRVLQCADCQFTFRATEILPATDRHAVAEALIDRVGGKHALLRQLWPGRSEPWPELRDATPGMPASAGPDSEAATVLLCAGQLDSSADPLPALGALRERLAPGQQVVFIYSDMRRAGAEIGSREWERLIGERNAYLDTQSVLTILFRAGFRCLGVRRIRNHVALEDLMAIDANRLVTSRWRRRFLRLIPGALRRRIHVNSRSADVAIVAVPRPTTQPVVSIVVPVYNEARTVAAVLDAVLRVSFRGAQLEVVVVESNSTDGSREIVRRYESDPRVTCVYEDRPRGKGAATRLGLERARGDVLLIQDADLEYDIEDYHSLVDPILRGHEAFMLGSRHGGRNHWKLRQFQKPMLAGFYNLAHVLVTAYINLLFGLRLRDPQTMFKVCRRDCIEGLKFEASFFNFDYELLLKIVRKGYAPTEVPVNYRSRSHAEGKKIRMWRDAPLGLWMITTLRLTRLRRFLSFGEPVE
jgi:hypothetical protein